MEWQDLFQLFIIENYNKWEDGSLSVKDKLMVTDSDWLISKSLNVLMLIVTILLLVILNNNMV